MLPPPISQGQRTLPPAEMHVARCFKMIYVGTVKDTYQGEEKDIPRLRLSFELPNALHTFKEENGPQPFVVDLQTTYSLGEKAKLRQYLNSWRGVALSDDEAKVFDIEKLLGAPCMIQVMHKESKSGNKRAEVATITKLMQGLVCPPEVNPRVCFDVRAYLQGDPAHVAAWEKLPEFIQKECRSSKEWAQAYAAQQQAAPPVQQAVVPPPTNAAVAAFEAAKPDTPSQAPVQAFGAAPVTNAKDIPVMPLGAGVPSAEQFTAICQHITGAALGFEQAQAAVQAAGFTLSPEQLNAVGSIAMPF